VKIDDLAILDAVFQEPNLTKVSERFHLTQSNVSKILKRVEMELGFSLFERKGFQGLRPTPQGLLFAERVGRFSRAWGDTLALVRSFDQRRLDIKVTGPALYMRNIFLKRWFSSPLPERYRLTYVEARIDQISVAAQAGDLDLAITPSPFELATWTPTPVFTERFSLFTAAMAQPTVEELRTSRWVAYHAVNDQIQRFFLDNQISPEQVVAYIEDIEGILDVLQTDPGLFSLLPSHAGLSHRKLKRFPWKQSTGQTLFLMYQRGNQPASILAKELKKLL
jgi:DNA-binding transcriptional LysR family regulator